jgi:hypothetical protein
MGSGRPLDEVAYSRAYHLGALIAEAGWVLLTGGRPVGVMEAASRGAREAGGLVVAVLPDAEPELATDDADIVICTGMGDARNVVNVLSSHIVIALPGGAGTISEVALGLKAPRTVIALGWDPGPAMRASAGGRLLDAATPQDAVAIIRAELGSEAVAR